MGPVAVLFIHPEPSCGEKYFAVFKCPVYIDADHDGLILKLEDADKHLPGGNPHLAKVAFLLGFSEHIDFSRAFKRWTD
jgi:AraC-like DNA-binding protein